MKTITTCFMLFISLFAFAQTNSKTQTDSVLNSKNLPKEKFDLGLFFDFKTFGFDVAFPTFRNDMVLNGYMSGPTIQYLGFMEAGILNGTAYKKGNPLLTQKVQSFFIGFKYNNVMSRRMLNVGPTFGLRFTMNELTDPYFNDRNEGTGSFAIGLHAGAFIKLGPVFLTGKMHADGNINFSKGSSFKGLSVYPVISIAFMPLNVLMNPKQFSHTALITWKSDYKSTITETSTRNFSGDVTNTTNISSSWKNNYGNQTVSCKDVQPFFFIGPRATTSFTHFNKSKLLSAYGVNVGVRRGALFLNGFFEKANVHFRDQLNINYDTAKIKSGPFYGRIDGEFVNSNRFGAQIGIELIHWSISKDFIYKESRLRRATVFNSIIPFVGYGIAQLGDLKFNSDSGLTSYTNFISKDPAALTDQTKNILLTKKNSQFYSVGIQVGFGAIALNTEYTFYNKSSKSLNNWNVGLSYNLPISRMVRSFKLNSIKRKYRNSKT